MAQNSEVGVAAAIAPLVTFGVAAALVLVRGEVQPSVIAVALAATVALCGRFGGREGGVAAALMAAASFDFLHTKPYLSLKIANGSDLLLTILLLGVGLLVGGLAGQAADDHRRARDTSEQDRLRPVLAIVSDGETDDAEAAVRAELLGLLSLRSCRLRHRCRRPSRHRALGAARAPADALRPGAGAGRLRGSPRAVWPSTSAPTTTASATSSASRRPASA